MPSKSSGTSNPEYRQHPFLLSVDELKQCLDTNLETGLTRQAAEERKARYGENKLSGEGGVKWYTVLGKQISNALILVSVRISFTKAAILMPSIGSHPGNGAVLWHSGLR